MYAGTGWVETLTVNTVGTDPIKFIQFGLSGTVTSVNGTANRITVTNPTTTPVIDIAASYVGQTSITTLGVVVNGTWNADPIDVPYGGTGITTTTAYGILCGGTTDTGPFQNAGTGTEGQILVAHVAAALPTWEDGAESSSKFAVNQVGHGFSVTEVIRCTGDDTYALAQANNVENAECIGMVVEVIDSDNFVFQFGGIIDVLSGLVSPNVYFLDSDTAGQITTDLPAMAGQVVKPLLVALNPTTALWQPDRGQELGTPLP